jgi:hypothetical protein
MGMERWVGRDGEGLVRVSDKEWRESNFPFFLRAGNET